MAQSLQHVLVGSDTLLISCAEILRERGQHVAAVVSDDAGISRWCAGQGIPVVAASPDYPAKLRDIAFDYLLSITNLAKVPDAAIAMAKRGAINFHDGLLPRYGGLQSPAWALMGGESEHGVTWHLMTGEFDTGAIVLQRRFPVLDGDTSLTLNTKCFEAGIESFRELATLFEAGPLPTTAHALDRATYHGRADRPVALAALDPQRPAAELSRLVRALDFGGYANPLLTPRLVGPAGAVLVTGTVSVLDPSGRAPGTIVSAGGSTLALEVVDGVLQLDGLADLAGRAVDAAAALRVLGLAVGDALTSPTPAFRDAAARWASESARYEETWSRRLAAPDSPELPGLRPRGENGTRESVAVPMLTGVSADDALQRSVVFLARLAGRTDFDVSYAAPLPADLLPIQAHLTPTRPLRIGLADATSLADAASTVREALGWVEARGHVLGDVALRRPALKARRGSSLTLPIAVARDATAHAAAASAVDADLVIAVGDDGSCSLAWDASALDAGAAADIAARLARFLASPSDAAWRELSLLSEQESTQLLQAWGTAPRRVARGADCIHEQIAAQASRTPDAVAIVCEDAKLSYTELDARANQLAHHLRSIGIGPESLVALSCARSLDLVVGMLGILKSGAAYVPVDPTYPVDRIRLMLEDSQARVIITQEDLLGEIPEGQATVVCLDRDAAALATQPREAPSVEVGGSNIAYCIYTSGSTGRPKGVMVEHRNATAFFAAMDERLGTTPGVWLAVTSLSFDISVLELCWTLARGFTVVLHTDRARAAETELVNTHKGVDFSLFYFSADEAENADDRYRVLMDGARFGDRHGFSAVWTPERHFHAFGGLYPNPAVTGAAVAAVTTRIGVRAGSCVLPLHHPVRVAEEWAVVDNLSGGRVGISFAAGWQPNDFIFQPHNYADAKQKTIELIDVVKRLWRGETISFDGPRGPVPVRTMPRPRQAELPVWFTTAGNPESYELAGRLGVNILTHLLGQSVDELADKLTLYRRAWKAAGHAGNGQVALMLHTFVGESDAEVKELVRGPMKAYLSTSISLIKGFASAFPTFKKSKDGKAPELDFQSLSAEEMDALLEYSFERYYETSGLFGTVETCAKIVDRLKGIGVDDVACLIDFGVPSELVLSQLRLLNRLRVATSRPRAPMADQSIPALIARHGVTHLQCTPSMATMLVADARSRDALRSLRTVCIGGEAFPPALAAELRRLVPGDIHNMYGPTETTIWSTMHTLDGDGPVPLGTPLAENECYVLDGLGQLAPPGQPGELHIGGAQVTRGYWRRPELTAQRFVPHPTRGARGERVYRTGDLVRWRADGKLEFLGRTDFQVKVRGYRIELGEIETALGAHPDVREAIVIARPGPDGDPRLVGYFTWKQEPADGVVGLREYLRRGLPDFMVPTHLVPLRDLPRTPNRKVDRNALPDPVAPVAVRAAAPVAPSGELEGVIAGIWREVLSLPDIGIDDNFFDLGGHSLLAVQVHSRLKRALERDLAITDLFRFPTIRGLAGFLGGKADESAVRSGVDRAAQRRVMAARRARRPGA